MNNLAMNNEQEIIDRIKLVRSGSEPVVPTEETTDLEVKPDESEIKEVEEITETLEDQAEPVDSDEPEAELDQEDFYIDLNGEEISFSQIEEWRLGDLRQSDYTRKTRALAEDRKLFEADKEATTKKTAQLDDSISRLQVFIDDFKQSDYDGMSLDELRDIDPGQYLKVTEQQAKRKKALKEAQKLKADDSESQRQQLANLEIDKLVKSNPTWVKDGKETIAYSNDMTTVKNYLNDLGVSEDQQAGILTTGHGQAYIDAAKYHASKKSNAAITKKVRKAPVITKPGGASKSVASKALEQAQDDHKRMGTPSTAFALRKAQKQFKGN